MKNSILEIVFLITLVLGVFLVFREKTSKVVLKKIMTFWGVLVILASLGCIYFFIV